MGLVGVVADVGQIIWMYQPTTHALFNVGYHFSGILVAGLVLAAFIKKPAGGT